MKEKPDPVLKLLPPEQVKRVLSQPNCDIEPIFMGFTDIYKHLSKIIPLHFTVIDFGCSYAPQCFYFTKHKLYIGVSIGKQKRFKAKNTIHDYMSIREWICENGDWIHNNVKETFAICSYVPAPFDEIKLLRNTFENLFVYYPHGGFGGWNVKLNGKRSV